MGRGHLHVLFLRWSLESASRTFPPPEISREGVAALKSAVKERVCT